MSRKFDPKQEQVLLSKETNQLVSAGAGSGKTTVMIKKITDLILSGEIKPSEIVVLTFTNLAAREMKERLVKALNQAIQLAKTEEEIDRFLQLSYEVETASVDTIDGFCSKITKKYFYKLNNSPDTNIATGLSLDYYINKSLDNCIAEALKTDRDAVVELADCFEKNSRSLDALKQNLLNAFTFIMAQKDYHSFLENALNEYNGLYKSASFLNTYLIENVKIQKQYIEEEIENLSQYENFYKSVKAYVEVLNRLDENLNLLDNVKFLQGLPKILTNRIKDEDKSCYNIVKNAIAEINEIIEEYDFLNKMDDSFFNENTKHFKTFINLLNKFIDCYQSLKNEYKVVDFTDLERDMLKLLSFEDIKADIYEQYKYIFVDEYQDINPMQNEIIHLLKSENAKIFFVGDVKQSIYGFRQSTPELFLELYSKYKTQANSQAFDMNINFRSNPKILEFNNVIFNRLMTKSKTDIDYYNDAQFEPKRDDFEQADDSVEIAVFDTEQEEVEYSLPPVYSVKDSQPIKIKSASENECLFVADKILSLVGTNFYDSAIKDKRKLQFSDIAILIRGINDAKTELLIKTLREHNIPISINNKITLSECESVNLIFNILKVISNIGDDVAYTVFATSSLGNISLDELFIISNFTSNASLLEKIIFYAENNDNELASKAKKMIDSIEEIKLNSTTLSNLELIEMLLYHYHLKQYILNSNNGEAELVTLNNFLANISSSESDLPLEEFINYLSLNLDSKTDYFQSDNQDAVTIQTIHASKGLEYPIVFLFNASKTFKPNNDRDDINFDSELGIGMQYFDLINRKKQESIPRLAIKVKNKIKCYKEELRLLYVATTRPQNKLIITGEISFKHLENGKLSSNNFIELIYSVFQNNLDFNEEKTKLKSCIFYHYKDYQSNQTKIDNINYQSFSINSKSINFDYPKEKQTNISLKNNVTAISKQLNEDYNILANKLNVKENLLADINTSAEIGTAYHSALSKLNYKSSYSKMQITDLDENLIKLAYEKIKPLTKDCIKIHQEAEFMMYVPYNEIYLSDIDDKVLVQGVVDLIIEFEDFCIIIDYKYSKSNIDTLRTKYDAQLKLYKIAVEKAFKKPVKFSYIYRINDGSLK